MGVRLGGGWIDEVPEPLRGKIRDLMTPVALDDGETLFREGDQADRLYQVVSGQIVITHRWLDHIDSIVTFFARGDCLGEQSLIDGLPRANTATARGPTTLIALTSDTFNALRAEHREIDEILLLLMSRRFRQVLKRIEEQAAWSLEERLARRLISLGEVEAISGCAAVELTMRLTQSDLAKWVGFSRQRVNMALGDFQRRGLISITGTRVRIEDLPRLREVCMLA